MLQDGVNNPHHKYPHLNKIGIETNMKYTISQIEELESREVL